MFHIVKSPNLYLMQGQNIFITRVALIVALGGFLMGFDASVISGVVGFIKIQFDLSNIELGWAVSSLTLTSTLAMMLSGPVSDKIGRRQVLRYAAILYAISALASAFAPNFVWLVIARMIGGLGVGASLIIAPMYIAEISPAAIRGRMVSFNQLNIVLGISVAFFSNYLILQWGNSQSALAQTLMLGEFNWRWMLGIEAIPAIIYFFGLFFVPRSPRWLMIKDSVEEAKIVMEKAVGEEEAQKALSEVQKSIQSDSNRKKADIKELFKPSLRLVLTIGVVIGILQQITGINAVFFYAPMIFEQSGIGTDAAFSQAIWVGVINLVFTILAIMYIDKIGRKPLLTIGVSGMAISLFLLALGFGQATYQINEAKLNDLTEDVDRNALLSLEDITFNSDLAFKNALMTALGEEAAKKHESILIAASISINPIMILAGILGFVASFAISLGPVMWVLFSELFPNYIRGIAISFAGLINSGVSFLVQLIFPWELAALGNASTFLIYGIFAAVGLLFIVWKVPETKGKSLEELEANLVH